MDRFEAMRVFVAVVERQGFSAASRSLSMPLPTVCRKIAELERHLGAQLLIRSTRRVVVTDPGRRYYASARRILDGLAEAEAEAAGEYRSPLGQLTITAPALFGRRHILPILRDFMAEHPDITARLLFTNFLVNLLDENADVGIRIGNLKDGSLVARKVGEVRHCYCASPGYLVDTPRIECGARCWRSGIVRPCLTFSSNARNRTFASIPEQSCLRGDPHPRHPLRQWVPSGSSGTLHGSPIPHLS